MLSNACVDSKVKYGCAVWNELNKTQVKDLNDLKVNLLKRAMEMPYSTPSSAIKYEFGMTDLDIEVDMEKILLLCDIMKKEDSVGKLLLLTMRAKKIPGICKELDSAFKKFGIEEKDDLFTKEMKEMRTFMKAKVIEIQSRKLGLKMMEESKSDRLLLNGFKFDGSMKRYLVELPFNEARVIFLIRCRMFPTKDNFKGRWGSECIYCSCVETDLHLFSCAGYKDILEGIQFDNFMTLDVSIEELSKGAKCLLKVKERLELFNKKLGD